MPTVWRPPLFLCLFKARARKGWKKPEGRGGPSGPGKGPSPARVTVLKDLLNDYLDQILGSYLLEGFTVGFQIHYEGIHSFVMSENLWSL